MNCAYPAAATQRHPATVNPAITCHSLARRTITAAPPRGLLQVNGRFEYGSRMPVAAETLAPIEKLKLIHAPVAVAFLPTPPEGLARIGSAEAAGCAYWKRAGEGEAFYTTGEDHMNCPVGAFTHGVALPPDKGTELQSLIGTMIELKYLASDEVPKIPHRTAPFTIAAYAPLASAAFAPDAVIFRGNARQVMLLTEAGRSAGVFESGAVLGRPACGMLPQ